MKQVPDGDKQKSPGPWEKIAPSPKQPDPEWRPVPGKPYLEPNRAGQFRYMPPLPK